MIYKKKFRPKKLNIKNYLKFKESILFVEFKNKSF